jgi:hypothetical protein
VRGLALGIVCGALLCRVVAMSVSLVRVAGVAGWVMWASRVAAFGCCVVAPPPAVVRAVERFLCCA